MADHEGLLALLGAADWLIQQVEDFIDMVYDKIAIYRSVVERINIQLQLVKMKIRKLQEYREVQYWTRASHDSKILKDDEGERTARGHRLDRSRHKGPDL